MDVIAFLNRLDSLFEAEKYTDVAPFLQRHLKQAQEEPDHAAELTVLNEMIGFFRSISDHKQAAAYSELAISKMQTLGLTQSAAYGTTLLNAATAYRAGNELSQAERYFEQAADILKTTLPPHDPRLAGLYNNLSSLYQAQKKYSKALDALECAHQALKGETDSEIERAVIHTNKALIHFQMGQQKEGMLSLQPALEIYAKTLGQKGAKSDPHYAAAISGLAEGCLRVGKTKRAIELYRIALNETEEKYGRNSDYHTLCKNYAVACEAMGRHTEADTYRKQADAYFASQGIRP